MKKILVIDGNSIINRAFYGVRPLTTKAGKHTNAIFGMINIISKQLSAIKPDFAAAAIGRKTELCSISLIRTWSPRLISPLTPVVQWVVQTL